MLMAVIAGIDEAGLGPTLGPLVVSGAAFRVPDDSADACLWEVLSECFTKDAKTGRRKIAIADSKRLYKPGGGLLPLERPVLTVLAQRERNLNSVRALLDHVAPGATAQLDEYPWYQGADLSLPVDERVGDIATRANAVGRTLSGNGVEFLGAFVEMLPAGHFNRLVAATRNKSVVLTGLVMRVAHRIMEATENEPIRINVDRLGGRVHYREALQTALPNFELRILEESELRSAYRLHRPTREVRMEFNVKGDTGHFAVALASMCSKYLRELCMMAFNQFWCARQQDLRPTAGYYNDAKRWLGDAADSIRRAQIQRDMLVRQR